MTFKEAAYGWFGWNEHLFLLVNGGWPHDLSALPLLGSALGNYWAAPVPFAALLWWARHLPDSAQRARVERQAYVFAASFLLAFALTALVKWTVDLPRPLTVLGPVVRLLAPEEAGHGFPSGHSVYAALLASALWPLARLPERLALVLWVLWVGCSRVALGAHFPADVLGAWLLALLCACATGLLWDRLLAGARQRLGLFRFSKE